MVTLNNPDGSAPCAIDGVWTQELSVIEAAGGPVLHMLRADSPLFRDFGEIYFSVVLPGAVKAWKLHREQSQNLAAPSGLVQVVVYDGRPSSPSMGKVESFLLGRPDYYRLLHIPPGVWYGFAGRSDAPAILANCVDIPHQQDDAFGLDADSSEIPYAWNGR
ncbi:MAG: dTDP-4-dehydrorhamnose 3,5-epimerase family protein [Desulfovibrio sp.]|jgi:dTDP-4-dehydrorhamnose 3,5-epimerase|nr:dTDP-4-dehydrorhamnose 3,5-epimerase family protein [Desulfovibrio sp.]